MTQSCSNDIGRAWGNDAMSGHEPLGLLSYCCCDPVIETIALRLQRNTH